MKKFTRESVYRALRTGLQTAIAYIATAIASVDFTDLSASKSALIGITVTGIAMAISAVMNMESKS